MGSTDVSAAGWAWWTYRLNARVLSIAAIPLVLMTVASQAIPFAMRYLPAESWMSSNVVGLALDVALCIPTAYLTAGYYGGVFDVADDTGPTIGAFFRPRNAVAVVYATVIITVVPSLVGMLPGLSMMSVLAGLAVWFLATFVVCTAVDARRPALRALTDSANIVGADLTRTLRLVVFVAAVEIAGVLTLGVGLLVAVPIATLATVFVYRSITDPAEQPEALRT